MLIYNAKTRDELEKIINEDLNKYINWLKGNKLSINADKTKFIIYKMRNKADINLKILINKVQIERVATYKYLGVIIDEKLKWENHINKIVSKIAPLLGAIKRSGIKLNRQSANNIYHAHIMSHIRYNICNWSSCATGLKEKVSTLINKAIKSLYKFSWLTPTVKIFEKTGYLMLPEIIVMEKAKLIFKLEKGIYNKNIQITKRNSVHNYNTRRLNYLNHIRSRTELSHSSGLSSAIRIYNKLPHDLKQSSNIKLFVKNLKCLLKRNPTLLDSVM